MDLKPIQKTIVYLLKFLVIWLRWASIGTWCPCQCCRILILDWRRSNNFCGQHWMDIARVRATSMISRDIPPTGGSFPSSFDRNLKYSLLELHGQVPFFDWTQVSRLLVSLDWNFQKTTFRLSRMYWWLRVTLIDWEESEESLQDF